MTGGVCEFGTPLLHHRQPAQQRSCLVLASLIHRLPRPFGSAPTVRSGCACARSKSRTERGGSGLRARRAARRRRKPARCRSNSFQNAGFVFHLTPGEAADCMAFQEVTGLTEEGPAAYPPCFGLSTCSRSRQRERESSKPARLSSRPRGSRWRALCSRQSL